MNKIVLLILLSFPGASIAQKYIFINNDIQKKAFTADTADIKVMNEGYVGFYRQDMDSIISYIKKIRETVGSTHSKNRYIQYKTGHTIFLGERFHYYYGSRYDINLYSLTNSLAGKIIITNSRFSNKINLKRIDSIIEYFNKAKR